MALKLHTQGEKMQRLLLSLLTLVFSFPLWAIDIPNQASQSQIQERVIRGSQPTIQLNTYNRLKIPQFRFEKITPPEEEETGGGRGTDLLGSDSAEMEGTFRINNGGLGNGGNESFYCSGQDEVMAYRRLLSLGRTGFSANNGEGNKGNYSLLWVNDGCRTQQECGGLPIDSKSYLLASPLFATNCHPLGRKGVWDDTMFVNPPGGGMTSPLSQEFPAWKERNKIDDQCGFLFGRYLVNQISGDVTPENAAGHLDIAISGHLNHLEASSPRSVDAPYDFQHLKWGFVCPQISALGKYQSNPLFRRTWGVSGVRGDVGDEWRGHHELLLRSAVSDLARAIAEGNFGDLSPDNGSSAEEREMADVIINVWNILKTMVDQVAWTPCSGWSCAAQRYYYRLRGLPPRITVKSCDRMAWGSIVEYNHDDNKLCIQSDVAHDCHSKRSLGSAATYNVRGSFDGHCYASYGTWRDGGIYEREWETNTGYEIRDSGTGLIPRVSGEVPASGYSPMISSLIAHQLVHAYFQRVHDLGQMGGWPENREALREEQLAVTAQAAVLFYLGYLQYAPTDFELKKNNFVLSYTTAGGSVQSVVEGLRLLYPAECRGYGGIYLGPLCQNMRNIMRSLRQGRVEDSQLVAMLHSMAPLLPHPKKMTYNGEVRDFEIPATTSCAAPPPYAEPLIQRGQEETIRQTINPEFEIQIDSSQRRRIEEWRRRR
ncbi:MAG: hypothetical protein HYT76_07840 [Deltaproteobacteria bacterium]|nr:hypothetical protein [Deltaproteobacteria bacterium]